MSDDLNQSDELRLPDDLAACEARLAGHLLVPSRLNRDVLLYKAGWQTGWAACEAATGNRAATTVSSKSAPGVPRRTPVAWSAVSAAVAASLAVAVTLAVQSAFTPRPGK